MSLRFEDLFAKRLSRIKPGLARVQNANEQLGWISTQIPSILIAGTNGKGTTSAFLWRLLAGTGLRCGLFTSPHLVSFAERIQMSDRPVTESELEQAIPDLTTRLEPELWAELSFFEASLLLGFLTWKSRRSQLNILEAGLGGRLDATNISNPDATVLTSIGIDHAAWLGNSVKSIAFEKASIIRPGRPAIVGFEVRNEDDATAMSVIDSMAALRGAPLFRLGRDFGVRDGYFWMEGLTGVGHVSGPLPVFFTSQPGQEHAPPYMVENFCTAAATALWWLADTAGKTGRQFDPGQDLAAMFERFSEAAGPWAPSLCGRFHHVQAKVSAGETDHRTFLFDVCHNPHGARRFVEGLDRAYGKATLLPGLVSILDDKDIGGILDVLSGKLRPLVLFKIPNERGFQAGSIPERYRHIPVADDFATAAARLDEALAQQTTGSGRDRKQKLPWVVCGSVLAVGEVLGSVQSIRVAESEADAPGSRTSAQALALAGCRNLRDRSGDSRKPDGYSRNR